MERISIRWSCLMLAVLALASAGCGPPLPAAGVTVPESDGSAPTIGLTASDERVSMGVESGGPAVTMPLTRKTGPLYLVSLGRDNESGIEDIQIFVTTYTTSCNGELCTSRGPLRSDVPTFTTDFPRAQPGESTSAQTVFVESLNLTDEIPQGPPASGGSFTISFEIYAVATNNLGGRAETARLTVTWSESTP